MSVVSIARSDPDAQSALIFLQELLRGVDPRDFAIHLWDGTDVAPAKGQPKRFTLVIQYAGALRRMFGSPTELSLGEAYIFGDYDVEGDVEAAVQLGRKLMSQERSLRDRLRLRS